MLTWFLVLLFSEQLYLAFLVGYLLLLTAASWKASRSAMSSLGEANTRFLILIPAHNEEHLLPDLLQSLKGLDYPASLFSVHVVADNCTDQTWQVASKAGARVHVRNDSEHQGKGFALNWLLDGLRQTGEPCDALVFLDADSIVSPNFLRVLSAHLALGEKAIQAYYAVRDPGLSWAGSLRYAALAVLHYLRPQGRMVLGCSAGLKGNGMAFSVDLMKQHAWSPSLTEDIELHMALLLAGERVTFAPDAIVWGEMPDTLANSTSQHMRWEQGRKQIARTYVPKLLHQAWRNILARNFKRSFLLFDAVMEFLLPPFSILAAASSAALAASVLLSLGIKIFSISSTSFRLVGLNLTLAVSLLIGQAIYLLSGLRAVRAPKQVYFSLLHTPRLVAWKIWQVLVVLAGQGGQLWVRTKRNAG